LKQILDHLWLNHQTKVRFVLVGIWNTIFGYLVFVVATQDPRFRQNSIKIAVSLFILNYPGRLVGNSPYPRPKNHPTGSTGFFRSFQTEERKFYPPQAV